jgi:hypothetical protein
MTTAALKRCLNNLIDNAVKHGKRRRAGYFGYFGDSALN